MNLKFVLLRLYSEIVKLTVNEEICNVCQTQNKGIAISATGVLSYSNHIMRRGLQESLTRCHVHLQHSEDAIDGYTALVIIMWLNEVA